MLSIMILFLYELGGMRRMEYFMISQDPDFYNILTVKVKLKNNARRKIEVSQEDIISIKRVIRFNVDGLPNFTYPDILDVPIFLLSNNISPVFRYHFSDQHFKPTLLIDAKQKRHQLYYLPFIEKIDCIHESTTFYPNKSLKSLILDKKKMNGVKICRIDGIMEQIVLVSLEIAESLLRRNIIGISIKKIPSI